MEPNTESARPMKRARTDAMGEDPNGYGQAAAGLVPQSSSAEHAYRAAESALEKLIAVDKDQALHLFKTHPDINKLLRTSSISSAPGLEQVLASHDLDEATEQLVQEHERLEEALTREIEGRKRDRQALEKKVKSSTQLCAKILQQELKKLEDGFRDLRNKIHASNGSEVSTEGDNDADVDGLRGLVNEFAETMSLHFTASVNTACRWLGHPISESPNNTSEAAEQQSGKATAPETVAEEIAEEEQAAADGQDAVQGQNADRVQDGQEPPNEASKKLYSTEYVNKHPQENFHHRASGRWLKGLPTLEVSSFTGVRGPGADDWKERKRVWDASRPKPEVQADPQDAQKKVNKESDEKGTLSRTKSQDPASARKLQELQNMIHNLEFKLKELRSKLEEEVRARRKAETELENMRKTS